ncbi:MAG TPA: hypothetical protein VFY93_18015 [Planctomycetota bacterium]|nr:hypothetical protein [Planctomycetota bacterium]
MPRRVPSSLLLPFLLAVARAEEPVPAIRLVPLRDGLRAAAPDGDLARIGETDLGKTALAGGVDLARPPHPIVAWGRKDDRLFYVFYKTTGNALGDRPYLIQRIKKIERAWKTPDAAPEETVTWQVEVFKTIGGELKRADEHFGSYGLGDNHRREIVKEYEIGFGEVPGVCEGRAWPFDPDTLYRMLQEYQADDGLFPKVKFERARTWTLTVSFDARGRSSVSSPELGFDVPAKLPDRNATLPAVDPASKEIVLLEGHGVRGVTVGKSSREDLVRALGEPIEDAAVGLGHHNLSFPGGLTVNLDPQGTVNTILTRAGFGGRTAKGATRGMYRDEIARLYGMPPKSAPDAEHWRYAGVQFSFDGFDRVKRIVIMRAR